MNNLFFKAYFFLFLFQIPNYCFSQNTKILRGIVRDKITNTPVPNVQVYTEYGSSTTNELGQYSLSLENTMYKPGDIVTLYTKSIEYGAMEINCPISNDFRYSFFIDKNPNTQYIVGVIKDSKSDDPIEGIDITAEIDGSDIHVRAVKTDAFGRFKIQIDKLLSRGGNFVRLLIKDSSKKYVQKDNQIDAVNINSFTTIHLDSRQNLISPSNSIPVKIITKEIIVENDASANTTVDIGDSIVISASGTICLGLLAGCYGPDGRPDHVYDSKSYFPQAYHGSLLVKVGDGSWYLCGSNKSGIATKPGDIYFRVNDRDYWNNTGNFRVSITIIKK